MSHCCQHSAGASIWQWGRLRRGREEEGGGGGHHTVKAIAGRRDARVCRGTIYCHTAAGRRGDALWWRAGGQGLQCSSVKRSWRKASKMHYRRCKRPERKRRKRRKGGENAKTTCQTGFVWIVCLIWLSKKFDLVFTCLLGNELVSELRIPEWLDWLPNEVKSLQLQSSQNWFCIPLAIIRLQLQKWSCNPIGMEKRSPKSDIKLHVLLRMGAINLKSFGWNGAHRNDKRFYFHLKKRKVNLQPLPNGPHNTIHTTEKELLVSTEADL